MLDPTLVSDQVASAINMDGSRRGRQLVEVSKSFQNFRTIASSHHFPCFTINTLA